MFSELLRKKREAAGLTRAELASASGLAVEVIDGLELGTKDFATFDNCYKISVVLKKHSGQAFIFQDLWCAARSQVSSAKAAREQN